MMSVSGCAEKPAVNLNLCGYKPLYLASAVKGEATYEEVISSIQYDETYGEWYSTKFDILTRYTADKNDFNFSMWKDACITKEGRV